MSTIRDVARAAGVSVSTVSAVLNGSRPVSPDLKVRVRTAIEQLHYRPNGVAKSLRSRWTSVLGLVVPDNANPFFADLGRAVENAAFQRGYSLILCNSDGQAHKEATYVDLLIDRRVDGVVLTSVSSDSSAVERMQERRIPAVMLDRVAASAAVDSVSVDHRAGSYAIVQHLLRLGHRRIACLGGPSYTDPGRQRLEGYLHALRDAGIQPQERWVREGPFDYRSGYALAQEVLAKEGVTALVAGNDLMAVGAMRAAADMGLRVPQDVSVTGFDDIPLADMISPRLSTVAQPVDALGRLAVELLLARREQPHGEYRHLSLPPATQIRESTAPVQ